MSKSKITLFNKNGDVIYTGNLESLPLSESLIIKKSIGYFNDDAPCFIHRSAVMNRLYAELTEFLIHNKKSDTLYFSNIASDIQEILAEIKGIESIQFDLGSA